MIHSTILNYDVSVGINFVITCLLCTLTYLAFKRGVFMTFGAGDHLAKYLITRSNPPSVVTNITGKKYLVIGGHGFVGSHIVEGLIARGETKIVVFDIQASPIFQNCPEVKFIQGDIRNYQDVARACQGVDTVFHTAAVINFYSRLAHDYQASYDVNYKGTENVIEACIASRVKQLIYTSSYTVVFDTKRTGFSNGDESLPYASEPFLNHYAATKIPAEKLVLSSNGIGGLKTGALRPTGGIFGPRDNIVTRMWKENEGGQIIFAGIPDKKQDWIYVENVAHSHFCMEAKMDEGADVEGQAYFISNNEPLAVYEMYKKFASYFDTRVLEMPMTILCTLAYVIEFVSWITKGKAKGQLFFLTPSTIKVPCTELYFNCTKAEKELGYKPVVTFEEGLRKTADYCDLFVRNCPGKKMMASSGS